MNREELKKILQSLNEEDYKNNVDLHIHTNESDGKMTPAELIKQVNTRALRFFSVTDHNTANAYYSSNILKEDTLITGIEFDCLYKANVIHILGYGIDTDNEDLKSLYSKNKIGSSSLIYRMLTLRNPEEVIEKIKLAGGIAVLAHPCCYWTLSLDEFVRDLVEMGLDGIEVYYKYKRLRKFVKFHKKTTVEKIADKYHLIKTGGTDSHGKKLL